MFSRSALLALCGRLLIATIFLASAFGKVTNFDGTVRLMEAHGVPLPQVLCAVAAAVEALGAIALVLGYRCRVAAGGLAAFVVAATLVFHAAAEPAQRVHLLKNIAIIGGLLMVVAFGPGEVSLEGRRN